MKMVGNDVKIWRVDHVSNTSVENHASKANGNPGGMYQTDEESNWQQSGNYPAWWVDFLPSACPKWMQQLY
jgi:hypothetical protein